MSKTQNPGDSAATAAELVREGLVSSRHGRFAQAYVAMAREANYRPQAPGDGLGGVYLGAAQLADRERLVREAAAYAIDFGKEDDACLFNLGCTNYSTNRASVYLVEAARLLAGGMLGEATALRLLRMAIDEVERATAACES